MIYKRNYCKILFLIFINSCLLWKAVPAEGLSGKMRLNLCVADYENGNYQKTAESLEALMPALSNPEEQMEAYKYLAFSYGMLNRIDKSKAVFTTVLKKFPGMNIDTLETPPNIAIILKQVKLEKKIETINSSHPKTIHPKTIVVVQKKNVVLPVVLLSCSIICAGASGDLFYYAGQQHQKYKSVDVPDQGLLDSYYSRYRNASIAGIVSAGVAAVLLPVSIYLFTKKEPPKKGVSLSYVNGLPSVMYSF